ncbi:MAG: hypothetical protein ACE5JM_10705 [Armatimonadota bacterium]
MSERASADGREAASVAEAAAERRQLVLRRPLQLTVEQSEGSYIVWNEEFSMHGVGETLEQALREFQENLIAVYESFVEGPPGELSDGAKKLRDSLAKAFQLR